MEEIKLNPSRIVGWCAVGVVAGVGVADYFDLGEAVFYYVVGLGSVLLVVSLVMEGRRALALAALFAFSFAFGMLRMDQARAKIVGEGDYQNAGRFLATITSDPTMRSYGSSFFANVNEADDAKVRVGSTVRAHSFEDFYYGQVVEISGRVTRPEKFITSGGSEFDYPGYLHARGANIIIEATSISPTGAEEGNPIRKMLFRIAGAFKEKMNLAIREPELSFAKGILIGDDSGIDDELQNAFVRTGTIHVLALSGYNVTIVADFFKGLFSFLPKLFALASAGVAIILFVIMTGAAPSAVRAGIMASIALFGKSLGRTGDAGMILVFASAVMIIVNPWQLLHDLGFQLSVIATWGILYIPRKIEKTFHIIPNHKFFPIREILVTSLSAWIAVSPFILFAMGNFSIIAPLANILVLPLMPFAMLVSFVSGAAGFILPPLAGLFGVATEKVLHFITSIIELLSRISWSFISVKWFGIVLLVISYSLLFVWVHNKKAPARGSF